jgi:hypothetical protein
MMNTRVVLAAIALIGATGLYHASNWWERAYATKTWSETSPDGCFRVDTYDAFRILPSVLHRIPSPDPETRHDLGMRWEAVVFKRAYEVSTGDFIGETIVFDPSAADDLMRWGNPHNPGRRVVVANGFPLIDSTRCSDPATLAKLDAFHKRRQEENGLASMLRDAEHPGMNLQGSGGQ